MFKMKFKFIYLAFFTCLLFLFANGRDNNKRTTENRGNNKNLNEKPTQKTKSTKHSTSRTQTRNKYKPPQKPPPRKNTKQKPKKNRTQNPNQNKTKRRTNEQVLEQKEIRSIRPHHYDLRNRGNIWSQRKPAMLLQSKKSDRRRGENPEGIGSPSKLRWDDTSRNQSLDRRINSQQKNSKPKCSFSFSYTVIQ